MNGINGYTVQSAPFSMSGLPMTMQVMATSGGVGFTYTAKQGASGTCPAAFPAVISGWGPGEAGIQLYGAYRRNTQISALQTVTSSWSFTTGSSGDAAYDVWFGNRARRPYDPGHRIDGLDRQRRQEAHRLEQRHGGRRRCRRVGRGLSIPVRGHEYNGAKGRQLWVGDVVIEHRYPISTC